MSAKTHSEQYGLYPKLSALMSIKNEVRRIICLVFICMATACFIPAQAAGHAVCTWQLNKKAAVSITLDDNDSCQFTRALPLMNAHKIRATFYVIPDRIEKNLGHLGYWEPIRQAARDGHENGPGKVLRIPRI